MKLELYKNYLIFRLCRVVSEIESVNKKLVACGLSDCLIGYVGVERLRKCVTLPQFRDHLTELNNLLSFLSITTHQEYLVQRLKELSQGGALSEFKWNGGGRFKGNEWTDKLPTDSELIMGFFAAYMDSRLPANFRNTALSGGNQHLGNEASSMSHYIEDKPFTGREPLSYISKLLLLLHFHTNCNLALALSLIPDQTNKRILALILVGQVRGIKSNKSLNFCDFQEPELTMSHSMCNRI